MKRGLLSLALAAVTAVGAFAQSIGVLVNGERVSFEGARPQQVNGRVLVPLRGVMEKLGAYVGYEPASKTVTATKGDVDITLRLGDRFAIVNGRQVLLDVPAQTYRGSTMVPLRFMSEAIGADVRWDAATYSVMIDTPTGQANDPIVTTPPVNRNIAIDGFTVDADGYLRSGSRLNFTLTGTPGGVATVQIPGVATEIALVETQPGVYTGTYILPLSGAQGMSVSKASAIAKLRIGNREQLIQAGTPIQVDTQVPLIVSTTPETNGRVSRSQPNITAVFDDQGGSGIDPRSVQVLVDNEDVTRQSTVTSNLVVYRPENVMSAGSHSVTVTARDRAGNQVNKSWTFRVADNSDAIRSFRHSAANDVRPGDEVTFTLVGEPGGRATFSIGDKVRNRPMREVSAGQYEGSYTVRRGDRFSGDVVSARLVTANGETYTTDAQRGIDMRDSGKLTVPKFTSPDPSDNIGREVTFRGTAEPGSRVKVRIDYAQTVLGAFKMTGTVAEQTVDVDDQGRWETRAINLDTGLGRGNVTYTVTAAAIAADDTLGEAAKLTIKK